MVPILIIDDAHEDLLLAERVLRQCGLVNPIQLFRESDELLDYFQMRGPDAGRVLMFVDLIMFPRNGIQVLESLKQFPVAQRSMSVVLTGLSDVRQIQLAYDAGATTFLLKPITATDVNQFLQAFRKHFSLRQVKGGKALEWADETGWRAEAENSRPAERRTVGTNSVESRDPSA